MIGGRAGRYNRLSWRHLRVTVNLVHEIDRDIRDGAGKLKPKLVCDGRKVLTFANSFRELPLESAVDGVLEFRFNTGSD